VVTRRCVTRVRVITGVVLAGLALASCAIPTQSGPSAIPPNRVPFGLLNHQLPTTTTTTPASVPVKVYLLGPDHKLGPESRVAQFPAPLKTVIGLLLEGPTKKEDLRGTRTAIPSNVRLLSATVSKSPALATVNFNVDFGDITGSATELAVAQVVFTVVAQTSLGTGVIFEIDGQTITVPVANGTQVPGPVYFAQFLPSLAT
jgi:spore germination protein GerM